MSSTPKHLYLYEAFGWEPPKFAHVGLLLDQDRNKLSKRNGTLDISHFRNQGVFPDALTNFVALLGWSHTQPKDVMSMKDLTKHASMKYTRGDTVVNFEKLWFLQRKHAARYAALPPRYPINPLHSLTELAVKPMVKLLDQQAPAEGWSFYEAIPAGEARENYVYSILKVDAQNYTTPREFIQRNMFFFHTPQIRKLVAEIPSLKLHNVPPHINHPASIDTLEAFRNFSAEVDLGWTAEKIKTMTNFIISRGVAASIATADSARKNEPKLKPLLEKAWSKVIHKYLRWALFAGQQGPDGAQMMKILGREETIKRLAKAETVLHKSRQIEKQKEKEKEAQGTAGVVPLVAETKVVEDKESGDDEKPIRKWEAQENEEEWRDLMDDDFI
jgi:glutamyl-tRNA synthetase